jgi:hypothetical protein
MEDEVFGPSSDQKKQLLLIGSSHLRRTAVHLDTSKWEVIDLCSGGFRINDKSVSDAIAKVDTLKKDGMLSDYVAIIQLFDNSVYQVGGPGGTRHLPVSDNTGNFHIDGPLLLADKQGIRDLTNQLTPLIKILEGSKKVFLTPLARYWLKPCCQDPSHHTNFGASQYLPALGSNIFRLRDFIRDSLYTKRTTNFRVLCPNRMLGIGPQLSDADARRIGGMWGPDPVHPSTDAYKEMAAALDAEVSDGSAKYTNPPRSTAGDTNKRSRLDLSSSRQEWVTGCSATLPRRDTISGGGGKGHCPGSE